MSSNAIRDGIRGYVAVYENLVRDPEQDKRAAAQAWPQRCREKARWLIPTSIGTTPGMPEQCHN